MFRRKKLLENAARTPSWVHVEDCRDSDARSGAVFGGVLSRSDQFTRLYGLLRILMRVRML